MTDVLAPVFVSYSRFLEVRARRLAISTELAQRDEQGTNDLAICSAPIVDDARTCAAVRVRAANPATGN